MDNVGVYSFDICNDSTVLELDRGGYSLYVYHCLKSDTMSNTSVIENYVLWI